MDEKPDKLVTVWLGRRNENRWPPLLDAAIFYVEGEKGEKMIQRKEVEDWLNEHWEAGRHLEFRDEYNSWPQNDRESLINLLHLKHRMQLREPEYFSVLELYMTNYHLDFKPLCEIMELLPAKQKKTWDIIKNDPHQIIMFLNIALEYNKLVNWYVVVIDKTKEKLFNNFVPAKLATKCKKIGKQTEVIKKELFQIFEQIYLRLSGTETNDLLYDLRTLSFSLSESVDVFSSYANFVSNKPSKRMNAISKQMCQNIKNIVAEINPVGIDKQSLAIAKAINHWASGGSEKEPKDILNSGGTRELNKWFSTWYDATFILDPNSIK